jgi:hypothetical protein
MSRTARKALFLLLALVLIGVLVYLMRGRVHNECFSWAKLGQALRGARLELLVLSLVTIYVCYWLRGLRWVRLCRHLGPAGIWSVFAATLMGFVAIVLLGRVGEPVRPVLIGRREHLPISSMFGIYVVERLLDIGVTIFLAGWSLVFLPELLRERRGADSAGPASSYLPAMQKAGFFFFAGLLAAVIFLAYLRATRGGILARLVAGWRSATGWRHWVAGVFAGILEGLQALRTWGDLAVALALTAAHWALVLAIYFWVPLSFGGSLAGFGLRDAVLTLACTMLGSTLQLPAIGGGSWAGSFLAMTLFLGIQCPPAIVAAVTLWLITFVGCGIVGIPLLLHQGMSLGQLRQMTKDAEKAREEGK